jgi:hypothetical protein
MPGAAGCGPSSLTAAMPWSGGYRPAAANSWTAPCFGTGVTTDPQHITNLDIRRHNRLGGIVHECQHAV